MTACSSDNGTHLQEGQKTSAIRKGMDIDLVKLGRFLSEKLSDAIIPTPTGSTSPGIALPLTATQFTFGQSNPTFLVVDSHGRKVVVRKKPPGSLLSPTAHAVEREYRVLDALGSQRKTPKQPSQSRSRQSRRHPSAPVPVPQVFVLCKDTSVMGTPFYVMEFLKGRIFEDIRLPRIAPQDRAAYFFAAIDALADLHLVDYHVVGLSDYGAPSRFYERQLKRLEQVSQLQAVVTDGRGGEAVGELYKLKDMLAWLRANCVADEASIVHGDYKMDNIVFDENEPRMIGIIDWELSTVGHPLSDLANMLMPWHTPSKGFSFISGFHDAPRPLPVPEVEELIRRYCERVGRPYPIPGWHFCVAFSFFRLAVIAQGVFARMKRGQASSATGAQIAAMFQLCAKRVHEIAAAAAATSRQSKL